MIDLPRYVFEHLLPDQPYDPSNAEHAKIGELYAELLELELKLHSYALNCDRPCGPEDAIEWIIEQIERTQARAPQNHERPELTDIQLNVLRQLISPAPDFFWNSDTDAAVEDLIGRGLAIYSHGHGNRPVPTEQGRAAWSGLSD